MPKLRVHPRIETILNSHDGMMKELAGDAKKIAKGYYTFQNDHDKGQPWSSRSRLSLRVSYVDQQLRISWRTVKYFKNRSGKWQRTVRHMKRGSHTTRYEEYILKSLARDWERSTVLRIERQMEHIRTQFMMLRALKGEIFAYSRACYKFDEINND